MLFFAFFPDDAERFFIVSSVKRRASFFDYARLFPCDLFNRISENFRVIERNARYNGKKAVFYYVRRVVSASESDFENDYIAFRFVKPKKSRGCYEIER